MSEPVWASKGEPGSLSRRNITMNSADKLTKRIVLGIVAACLSLLLSSCGTSRLTAAWHDRQFAGKHLLQDVFIVAQTGDDTLRRLFEDAFVVALAREGVTGLASYTRSRPDMQSNEQGITAAAREAGARTVLLTTYLGTDTREEYRPPQSSIIFPGPYYRRFHRYYPFAYREVYSPGYRVEVTTISFESKVYETQSGSLVWSTRSESISPSMTEKSVVGLVKLFIADLKKSALL